MKIYKAVMDGEIIADSIKKADGFFTRLRGWMGKKKIEEEEGLLLCPCRQIHTFLMRVPIDAVFLSSSGEILWLEDSMPPGKISPYVKDCVSVLELKGGTGREKAIEVSKNISFL